MKMRAHARALNFTRILPCIYPRSSLSFFPGGPLTNCLIVIPRQNKPVSPSQKADLVVFSAAGGQPAAQLQSMVDSWGPATKGNGSAHRRSAHFDCRREDWRARAADLSEKVATKLEVDFSARKTPALASTAGRQHAKLRFDHWLPPGSGRARSNAASPYCGING